MPSRGMEHPQRVVQVALSEMISISPEPGMVLVDADTGDEYDYIAGSWKKFGRHASEHAGMGFSRFESILSKSGAVLSGASDDSAALQNAFSTFSASYPKQRIMFPGGISPRLDVGIVLDAATLGRIDWGGALIDATRIGSGIAIRFNGTVSPPYGQAMCSMEHFKLFGPGISSGKGIQFNEPAGSTSTDPGPSKVSLRNFYIRDFGVGIDHYNHSYSETFFAGEISNCQYGIQFRYLPIDAGEAPNYVGCRVYNCTNGIWIEDGANTAANLGTWIKFIGGSLDYNQTHIRVAGAAKVECIGTHLEGNAAAAYAATVAPLIAKDAGSLIRLSGGQFVYNTAAGRTIAAFVDNSVPAGQGGVIFDGVDMMRGHTQNTYFSTGVGSTILRNITTLPDRELPLLISAANNEMVDGGFENASTPDLVFVSGDTAAITSKLTGTNITITNSSGIGPFHGGARALRVNKVGAAATAAKLHILVPIKHGSRGSFRGYFRKSVAGNVGIQPVYAYCASSSVAGTVSVNLQVASEAQITFSDASSTWVAVQSALAGRKNPFEAGMPNPTHYGIQIDLLNMNSHNLDIDDLEIAFV